MINNFENPSLLLGVVWSKISRGYVKVDGLGEILLLPEQNRTKIDREPGRVKHVLKTQYLGKIRCANTT